MGVILIHGSTPLESGGEPKPYKRSIFFYQESELDDLMSRAWKPGATAIVVRTLPKTKQRVKASSTPGVWK
jgi:hypothetical protein